MHRYEMAHERSLRRRSVSSWPWRSPAPTSPTSPRPSPSRARAGRARRGPGRAGGRRKIRTQRMIYQQTCGKLASVGAAAPSGVRPGRSAGSPGASRTADRGRSGAGNGPETTLRFVNLDG